MRKQGVIQGRFRNKLHIFGGDSIMLVLIVDPAEKPSIESHIAEQLNLGQTVSKSVYLPCCSGHVLDSESAHDPQMSLGHIVDDVLVVTGGLVVHGNASAHELQLLILDQLPDFGLLVLVLLAPPLHEEPDLDLDELVVGVGLQLSHVVADYLTHVELQRVLVVPVIVVVQRSDPAEVVVAVRHKVHFHVTRRVKHLIATKVLTKIYIIQLSII